MNTGTREQELCGLKWSHEVKVPEFGTSVLLIPAERVKNGEERLVVLNRVARSVIDSLRGGHPDLIFVREFKTSEPHLGRGIQAPPGARVGGRRPGSLRGEYRSPRHHWPRGARRTDCTTRALPRLQL